MPFTAAIILFLLIAMALAVVAFVRRSRRLALMAGGAFVMTVAFAAALVLSIGRM